MFHHINHLDSFYLNPLQVLHPLLKCRTKGKCRGLTLQRAMVEVSFYKVSWKERWRKWKGCSEIWHVPVLVQVGWPLTSCLRVNLCFQWQLCSWRHFPRRLNSQANTPRWKCHYWYQNTLSAALLDFRFTLRTKVKSKLLGELNNSLWHYSMEKTI